MPLNGLHIFIREAGVPADGGEEGAEFDAAHGSGGFFEYVAYLRLSAAAVLGRAHAQGAMGFLGQVPYGQSGRRGTLFRLKAMLSFMRL